MREASAGSLNGLLSEVYLHAGEFDQCLAIDVPDPSDPADPAGRGRLRGQHFLATVLPADRLLDMRGLEQGLPRHTPEQRLQLSVRSRLAMVFSYPAALQLEVGLCLPSTCERQDLLVALNQSRLHTSDRTGFFYREKKYRLKPQRTRFINQNIYFYLIHLFRSVVTLLLATEPTGRRTDARVAGGQRTTSGRTTPDRLVSIKLTRRFFTIGFQRNHFRCSLCAFFALVAALNLLDLLGERVPLPALEELVASASVRRNWSKLTRPLTAQDVRNPFFKSLRLHMTVYVILAHAFLYPLGLSRFSAYSKR